MPGNPAGELLEVDPRILRLPPTRSEGADPVKLHKQIAKYGKSTRGMPYPEVTRGANGELMINDGVTRATRVAKLLPGRMIMVEVTDNRPKLDLSGYPTIGDKLP